ncbi:MAG: hypothetical protein FWG12_03560 [Holophagaceae bacterium]|nr:hypothetical protein [Holophagaceae bacterium]
MHLRSLLIAGTIYAVADCQALPQIDRPLENEAINLMEDFILQPKPWWLKIATKEWQWVALEPKIYHPPKLNPPDYPAIIEHEKVHLMQQRKIGKSKWFIKYIASKRFRLIQEMEPIVAELSNTPLAARKQIAIKYAHDLSGPPYHRAAKSFEIAWGLILSKASEMDVELEVTEKQ